MLTATEAKTNGIQASLWDASTSDHDTFLAALDTVPAGARMSLNTIRKDLDRARVPSKHRAGFMRQACAESLLTPVTTWVEGEEVQVGVPSTGESAKGAYVKLYTRTALKATRASSPTERGV